MYLFIIYCLEIKCKNLALLKMGPHLIGPSLAMPSSYISFSEENESGAKYTIMMLECSELLPWYCYAMLSRSECLVQYYVVARVFYVVAMA